MTRKLYLEGVITIFAGFYALTNNDIYDSLVGAFVDISITKYPIGVGLISIGIYMIFLTYKNNKP